MALNSEVQFPQQMFYSQAKRKLVMLILADHKLAMDLISICNASWQKIHH